MTLEVARRSVHINRRRATMVARYGHAADLLFTPSAHVNHIMYVRTSSSTCERGVLRANVDMVDVRTWGEK